MKNIKLYIDKQIVDLDLNNLSIVLTKQITNFYDLSSRKGEFSYSFKIPITGNNMKIFKFIDSIDVINKFNKRNDYSSQLYVDDNLLFEGSFTLQNIDKKYYNGNLNAKFLDVLNLIGEKSLQDLKLPEIDFEGVQFKYDSDVNSTFYSYTTGNNKMLNPSLGFDMMSLLNGFKSTDFGLLNSSIDYQNYYTCERLNYSNDYINGGEKSNQINANTNIYDLMPRIKMMRVLEQIFKDINLIFNLNDSLLNDETIFIPYTGEEDPIWNWKHLASLEVSSDQNEYGKATSTNEAILYWENKTSPVIISQELYANLNADFNPNDVYGLQTTNAVKNINHLDDKTFTNFKPNNSYTNNGIDFILQTDRENSFQYLMNRLKTLHYIPTNKLLKDPLNNFETHEQTLANDRGWSYSVPVSGEYEFDLNIKHDIKIFNLNNNDYKHKPNYTGYEFQYNSNEYFYYQNCVMIVKDTEESRNNYFGFDDLIQNSLPQNKNIYQNVNRTRLSNLQDENVIAFYHPMLRDLHKGDLNSLNLEEYFQQKNSILAETDTYPKTAEDRKNYYGFNLDTTILKYDNNIFTKRVVDGYSVLPNQIQKQKKLVYCDKSNNGYGYSNGKNSRYSRREFGIAERKASGNVSFKFKTKLKKGETIRLYYLTYNMMTQLSVIDWESNGYNYGWFATQESYTSNIDINSQFPYHFTYGDQILCNHYGDMYTDDINVNSYKINLIDEKYSDKLKLANFLPNIKQKDFILDWIKTNNLFFDIKDNTITFQKRNNFYKDKAKKDLTKNVSIDSILIEPNRIFETTKFGYKYSDEDDLRESIDLTNPTYEYKLDSNIYTEKSILDNRSIIFNSTGLRSFEYYKNNDATNINTIPQIITIPNLTENNTINKLNDLTLFDGGFKTSNRLLKSSGNFLDLTSTALSIKINGITFFQNDSKRYDGVPNLNIGLPTLYDSNETLFNNLFNDKFINLTDTSLITFEMYLTPLEYSQLNLNEPVKIQNTLYYIQSVEDYNVLKNNLCKVKLMKF